MSDDAHALALALGCSPLRLRVLQVCAKGAAVSVAEVSDELEVSMGGARRHLRALKQAGLATSIRQRIDGRRWHHAWRVDPDEVRDLVDDLGIFLGA